MTNLIVVISLDDTYMHVGPPDKVDEHLFGCAACTATSARVAAVTEAVREALPPVVSRARVDKLRASGLRLTPQQRQQQLVAHRRR